MKLATMLRHLTGGLAAVLGLAVVAAIAAPAAQAAARPQHVFVIVLENQGYHITFGRHSPAHYLKGLARQGALLTHYYGIGHNSLDNYIAMISGQAPNPVTQADCQNYVPFAATGSGEYGQALGSGCVYQRDITTLANQLQAKGLSWKGYMEDMGKDPAREETRCGRPAGFNPDSTQHAAKNDQYAARHNPFVYFYAITDDAAMCAAHVVNLAALASDLERIDSTPHYAFITPNLCDDGHDGQRRGSPRCADREPGGLISADAFLKKTVPMILAAPAFRRDGLLIITFDEADIDDIHYDPATGRETYHGDATACCGERPAPNIHPDSMIVFPDASYPDRGPGIVGPGGGRIGAVVVSPLIAPGTVSDVPYNHYSFLRSVEDWFGLPHLGYAGQKGLRTFGRDVFTGTRG